MTSSFITTTEIDTVRVSGARAALSGTLSYIPGSGIVLDGIEHTATPGITLSATIQGDTLRIEAATDEKAIPVVKSTTLEKTTLKEQKDGVFQKLKTICCLFAVFAFLLIFIKWIKR